MPTTKLNPGFRFYFQFDDDSDTVKLQVKWTNIFIPDLNDIFVIPQPEAQFNLLDRVVIVRSGYPVRIVSHRNQIKHRIFICHLISVLYPDASRNKGYGGGH